MKRSSVVAILSSLTVLALAVKYLPTVRAHDHDDDGERVKILDRDSVVYGRTYSDWNAAWWQWADSIPTATHPLFDNGDCGVGQAGPVWFLGGKYTIAGTSVDTSNVVRSCNVPAGKALYVAVYNAEDSVLEESTPGSQSPGLSRPAQIGELRFVTQFLMDGVTSLSMQVDGENIRDIKERFRVQSPVFGFTFPTDNFFTAVGEGPFQAGTYFPAVDDGFYVMVAPLPIGHHTIHFQAISPPYTLGVTYNLHVSR